MLQQMNSIFDRRFGSVHRGGDLGQRCTCGIQLAEALLISGAPFYPLPIGRSGLLTTAARFMR
jgi:hypothetical protein